MFIVAGESMASCHIHEGASEIYDPKLHTHRTCRRYPYEKINIVYEYFLQREVPERVEDFPCDFGKKA